MDHGGLQVDGSSPVMPMQPDEGNPADDQVDSMDEDDLDLRVLSPGDVRGGGFNDHQPQDPPESGDHTNTVIHDNTQIPMDDAYASELGRNDPILDGSDGMLVDDDVPRSVDMTIGADAPQQRVPPATSFERCLSNMDKGKGMSKHMSYDDIPLNEHGEPELSPITAILDGLVSEDRTAVSNSMQQLHLLGKVLGPERTCNELVPYLTCIIDQLMDDEDEIIKKIPRELYTLSQTLPKKPTRNSSTL